LSEVRNLVEYLADFVKAGRGLILHGSVGTGKDHIIAALLYRAVSEHSLSARWVNGLDLFGAVRDRMDEGKREGDFLRTWSAPTILAISDPIPPLRDPSAWNIEILYRLIDRRYRNNKSTWMTLNAASVDEADEKLSAPVFDRLKEDAVILRCFWPSYREIQKKRA
jgi:DNA replication protein DnaC